MNYVLEGDSIVIRVAPHSALAQHLRDSSASFQIDDVEPYSQSGWSVLVRGSASYVDSSDLSDDMDRLQPWADGTRSLYVRIIPREISGRRLLPA